MKRIKLFEAYTNFEAHMNRAHKMRLAKEELDDLKDQRKQLDIDMENEAGSKGDKWTDKDANRYGGQLDKLDKKIEKAQEKYDKAKDAFDHDGKKGPREVKPQSAVEHTAAVLRKDSAAIKKSIDQWPDRTQDEQATVMFKRYFGPKAHWDGEPITAAVVKKALKELKLL